MMGREARRMFLAGEGEAALEKWKNRYYSEKLGVSGPEGRRAVVGAYIQGLHWVLEYYYRGVASWNWFYPYHYAPTAADMTALHEFGAGFDMGRPFLPFEQLLGVLPAASCKLLPKPYEALMKSPSSPIIDNYPTSFVVDMEGKRADWEGVVAIPFIDEARLLEAARSIEPSQLTADERARNTLGSIHIFAHRPGSGETSFCASTLPGLFPSLPACNSRCEARPPPPPLPAGEPGFEPCLVQGTKIGAGAPAGFATLRTLRVRPALKQAGVEVFGQPSKKDSVILAIQDFLQQLEDVTPQQVAEKLVGQRCWVRWPYLQEAVAVAVSDREARVGRDGQPQPHGKDAAAEWGTTAGKLAREYQTKQGIDIGRCDLVLHVKLCQGLVREVDGSIQKQFSDKEVPIPLQASLRANPAPPDPRTLRGALAILEDGGSSGGGGGGRQLAVGSRALYLGPVHYGCLATLLPPVSVGLSKQGEQLVSESKLWRVAVAPAPPTAAAAAATSRRILANCAVQYMPSGLIARRLGLSSRTLGRITSNVWIEVGSDRHDVGLCIKHGSKSLCVPDYAAPSPGDKGWSYSQALVQVVTQYKARHPWVFRMLEDDAEPREYTVEQVLADMEPDARVRAVNDVRRWLKALPLAQRPLVPTSAQVAPEDAVRTLQATLSRPPARPLDPVELENVAPLLLLPPAERGAPREAVAGRDLALGDRVAVLGGGAQGAPPLGSRGTVVGVYDGAVEVLFDAAFPGGSDLHGRCNGECGAILAAEHCLNLSKPVSVLPAGGPAPRTVPRARSAASPTQRPKPVNGEAPARTLATDIRLLARPSAVQNGAGAPAGGLPIPVPVKAAAGGGNSPPGAASNGVQRANGGVPSGQGAAAPPAGRGGRGVGGQAQPKVRGPKGPAESGGGRGFAVGRGRALDGAAEAAAAPGGAGDQGAGSPVGNGVGNGSSSPPSFPQGSSGSMGFSFLQQLQGGPVAAAPAAPPHPPPPALNPGSSLLQALQAGSGAAAAAPAPPPPQDLGMGLLQRLQQAGSAGPGPSQAPPPPSQQQLGLPTAQPAQAIGRAAHRSVALLPGRQPAGPCPPPPGLLDPFRAQAGQFLPGDGAVGLPQQQPGPRGPPPAPAGAAVGRSFLQLLRAGTDDASPTAPTAVTSSSSPPGGEPNAPAPNLGRQLLQQLWSAPQANGAAPVAAAPQNGAASRDPDAAAAEHWAALAGAAGEGNGGSMAALGSSPGSMGRGRGQRNQGGRGRRSAGRGAGVSSEEPLALRQGPASGPPARKAKSPAVLAVPLQATPSRSTRTPLATPSVPTGRAFLDQLQSRPAGGAAAEAAQPVSSVHAPVAAATAGLDSLWQRLQQQHSMEAQAARVRGEAAAPPQPPQQQQPASAGGGAAVVQQPVAAAMTEASFWAQLQQASGN